MSSMVVDGAVGQGAVGAPADAVVAVPDFTLSTAVARNVLPGSVLHSDAVFNGPRRA